MHDSHQRLRHAPRVAMLDNIAAIHDASGAFLHDRVSARHDLFIGCSTTATDEHGYATGRLDDTAIGRQVITGIGFDDVGSQLNGLAYEWHDLLDVAIHHIAPHLFVGLHD